MSAAEEAIKECFGLWERGEAPSPSTRDLVGAVAAATGLPAITDEATLEELYEASENLDIAGLAWLYTAALEGNK